MRDNCDLGNYVQGVFACHAYPCLHTTASVVNGSNGGATGVVDQRVVAMATQYTEVVSTAIYAACDNMHIPVRTTMCEKFERESVEVKSLPGAF